MCAEEITQYKDSFGFLPKPVSIHFDCGSIYPVENYDELTAYVHRTSNKDGFRYPRMMAIYTSESSTFDSTSSENVCDVEIPRTKRPCPIQHVPVSHNLVVENSFPRANRFGVGNFLIQLTAFLYGVRTQFHDWRIDGRVPVENRSFFYVPHGKADEFFNTALKTWRGFPEQTQDHLTNILYVHAKAKSEEYEWLAFTLFYFVFDACYHILKKQNNCAKCKHEQRLYKVAEHFGMIQDQESYSKWKHLRNNMIHEAIWCGESPGFRMHHQESNLEIFYLQNFTSRVIAGLLGHRTAFLSGLWKTICETGFR